MYRHNHPVIKKRGKKPILAMMALAVLSAGLFVATARSILSFPVVQGISNFEVAPQESEPVKLPWPKYGQSAVGAKGYGVLDISSDKKPQPAASVAKVMTALAILDKHPLNLGEQGPKIPITQADEDLFGEYWAKNGTSVRLAAGEEISLYKALQYILIPSANNVADTTVVWAFGSMKEYSDYANELGKKIGMENSNFADASGFSPKTTSTASDLVRLGGVAMENPIIAEIVKTWEIELPDGNKAQNSNVFLDYENNGVIGIKTGDTDQAGGVYLTAAEHEVDGQTITTIAAVMGAKTLTKAQQDSMKLLASAKKGFSTQKVVDAGQVVGSYDVPWQGSVDVVSDDDVYAVVWAGKSVDVQAKLINVGESLLSGQIVGEVIVDLGGNTQSQPATLIGSIEPPSTLWRLMRYF